MAEIGELNVPPVGIVAESLFLTEQSGTAKTTSIEKIKEYLDENAAVDGVTIGLTADNELEVEDSSLDETKLTAELNQRLDDIETDISGKEPAKGTDDNYVTDAEKIKLSNLSNTNTGDETLTSLGTKIAAATAQTSLSDTDKIPFVKTLVEYITWANVKTTIKTWLDSLETTFTNKTLTSPKINENVALTPTSTELNYVKNVTSAIQTQFNTLAAKDNIFIITNNTFTPSVTENYATNTIRFSWTGHVIIVNPLNQKYGTLINTSSAVAKTIDLDNSTNSVCYIKLSEITGSGSVLSVYYAAWTNALFANPDNFILLTKNEGGLYKYCGGAFKKYFDDYAFTNGIKLQRRINTNLLTDSGFVPSVTENYSSANTIKLTWVGKLVVYSGLSSYYNFLVDNSPSTTKNIILDNGANSVCYIKMDEIVSGGGSATLYYCAWSNPILSDSNILIIAEKNAGGTLAHCRGLLPDLFKGYMMNATSFMGGSYSPLAISAVIRLYAHIPFTNGAVLPVNGDSIRGATSGRHGVIHSVKLVSGTFAGGDAAGYLVIHSYNDSDVAQKPSFYASSPFTNGENITNVAGSIVYCKMHVSDLMYGGFQQIDGSHKSTNISDFFVTNVTSVTINHNIGAINVHSIVACPDEGWVGYTMGCSVGLTLSYLYIKKLSVDPTTHAITGAAIDYTSLANCTTDDNIWILGILSK